MFMHRNRAGVDVVADSCSDSVFERLLKMQDEDESPSLKGKAKGALKVIKRWEDSKYNARLVEIIS